MSESEIVALGSISIFGIVFTMMMISKEGIVVGAVVGFVALVTIIAMIYAFMETVW